MYTFHLDQGCLPNPYGFRWDDTTTSFIIDALQGFVYVHERQITTDPVFVCCDMIRQRFTWPHTYHNPIDLRLYACSVEVHYHTHTTPSGYLRSISNVVISYQDELNGRNVYGNFIANNTKSTNNLTLDQVTF